jgi:hypothetical protein
VHVELAEYLQGDDCLIQECADQASSAPYNFGSLSSHTPADERALSRTHHDEAAQEEGQATGRGRDIHSRNPQIAPVAGINTGH